MARTVQVSNGLAASSWQRTDKVLAAHDVQLHPCIRHIAAGGCNTAASMCHQYELPDTAPPLDPRQSSLVMQSL